MVCPNILSSNNCFKHKEEEEEMKQKMKYYDYYKIISAVCMSTKSFKVKKWKARHGLLMVLWLVSRTWLTFRDKNTNITADRCDKV